MIFQKKKKESTEEAQEREINNHSERQTEGEETWKEKQGREKKGKNVGNEKTNSKESKHQESVKNGTNKE